MKKQIDYQKFTKETIEQFQKNLDKIDPKTIESEEKLITYILKLYSLNISETAIAEWAKKSSFYYPNIVQSVVNNGIFMKATRKKDVLGDYIKWFCAEAHIKLYDDDIRYEKNVPFLIDCLDYDRYVEIFYDMGVLYTVRKFSKLEAAKDTKDSLWQEVRLHIKPEIIKQIKYNKLSARNKAAIDSFTENVNKDAILTEEQKQYKINEFTESIICESKNTVTINDFYIETKKEVNKIQPSTFNNLRDEFNQFQPGLIENLEFNSVITECPKEFNKLLDNLAGEKEKAWLINHMAAYIQNFMSGWKLHKKIETIPLFYGKQGTGKNTIMEMFNKLIAKDFLCEVDRTQFESGFNEWKKSAVVLLNEFGKSKEDKRDFSDKIKLLTSPTFKINEKFKPVISIENRLYIAIAANESLWGVLNIEETDRRVQYICGGNNISKNEAFASGQKIFDLDELERELADFGNFLIHYKVDWDRADTVFTNYAKEEDREASLDQYELVINDWLENNPERSTVAATEIFNWGETHGFRNLNSVGYGKRLKKMFGKAIFTHKGEAVVGDQIVHRTCLCYKLKQVSL